MADDLTDETSVTIHLLVPQPDGTTDRLTVTTLRLHVAPGHHIWRIALEVEMPGT
jgi:hypothetical protein